MYTVIVSSWFNLRGVVCVRFGMWFCGACEVVALPIRSMRMRDGALRILRRCGSVCRGDDQTRQRFEYVGRSKHKHNQY